MTVSFDLPVHVERSLREKVGDVNRAAMEAALVELYRQDALTHFELGDALGLSRFGVDALLKRHNVIEDLIGVEEFDRQAEDDVSR